MKHFAPALALLVAACPSTAPLPRRRQTPATALAGTPCEPPMEIPPGIVASVPSPVRETHARHRRPAITPEDGAAYQQMQAASAPMTGPTSATSAPTTPSSQAQPAPADRIVFMGDSITQNWRLAHPDFFGPTRVSRGISGQTTPQMLLRFKRRRASRSSPRPFTSWEASTTSPATPARPRSRTSRTTSCRWSNWRSRTA